MMRGASDSDYDVTRFGAAGDGAADDTAAIQAAIDVASSSGGRVYFPRGTYRFVPTTAATDEGGACTVAFTMRSNMQLFGDRTAILKLADNQSTNARPRHLRCFFSNQVLSNISFRGLTIDMNGANNKINGRADPLGTGLDGQDHILFSGTPGGVAARCDNMVIDSCRFLNTAGTTCIGMMQSNRPGVTLGKRWQVTNNEFLNNGLDTIDHSSVYGWSDDVICRGNTFDSAFGNVAYEVHGARQQFTGNIIRRYSQIAWVGANRTSDVETVLIADNIADPLRRVGVDFSRPDRLALPIHGVRIERNSIVFDNTVIGNHLVRAGVQIVGGAEAALFAVTDVEITGNKVVSTSTGRGTATRLFQLAAGPAAGQVHDRITVRGNTGRGMSYGIRAQSSAANPLGTVVIDGNTFYDCAFVMPYATAIGVSADGTAGRGIGSLTITNNRIIDTRREPQTTYGIYVSGGVTEYIVSGNSGTGCATEYREEPGFSARHRGLDD